MVKVVVEGSLLNNVVDSGVSEGVWWRPVKGLNVMEEAIRTELRAEKDRKKGWLGRVSVMEFGIWMSRFLVLIAWMRNEDMVKDIGGVESRWMDGIEGRR